MRTTARAGGASPLRRAFLLLPLVAGVLAMHVLLLCGEGGGAGADPMAAHAGHGASVVSSAVPGGDHAAPAGAGEARAVVASVVAASTGGVAHDASHGVLVVCVAVLVTAAALVLTRASWGTRGSRPVPWRHRAPSLARTHPPPLPAAGLLLCVSRT